MAYSPLSQRRVVVEGIQLPARSPTAAELECSRSHRRKDDAAARRTHMAAHVAPPYRHYMTSARLRHRHFKSTVEEVNSGIAAQLATRERHRIDQF